MRLPFSILFYDIMEMWDKTIIYEVICMADLNQIFDLNQLMMEDIDFSGAREGLERLRQMKKQYQEKYGDDWWEHYVKDTGCYSDMDSYEKTVNDAIFEGHFLCISGDPYTVGQIYIRYHEKMTRLFGPFYRKYVRHEPNDPKINQALLKDAIKSGKWRELPNELHDAYHKMAVNCDE